MREGEREGWRECKDREKGKHKLTAEPSTLKPTVKNFRHSFQNSVPTARRNSDVIHTT